MTVQKRADEHIKLHRPEFLNSGSGGGVIPFILEGPDIDLVVAGLNVTVGRGGDKILLFDSGGNPIAEYAATNAGLVAAVAAATSGDIIRLYAYNIALTQALTLAAGVSLCGIGWNSKITAAGFNGAAITMAADCLCENFELDYTSNGADSVGIDASALRTAVRLCHVSVSGGAASNIAVKLGVTADGPATLSVHGTSNNITHVLSNVWSDNVHPINEWTGAGFRLQSAGAFGAGYIRVTVHFDSGSVPAGIPIKIMSSNDSGSSGVIPNVLPTLSANTTGYNAGYAAGDTLVMDGNPGSAWETDGYFCITTGWAVGGWSFGARITLIEWLDGSTNLLWSENYDAPSELPLVAQSKLEATGTAADAINVASGLAARVAHNLLDGDTYDIHADGHVYVEANEHVNGLTSGTPIDEWGDRSAWDVTNYAERHASDINAAAYLRHLFLGTAAGDLAGWNGAAWARIAAGANGQLLTGNTGALPSFQSFDWDTVVGGPGSDMVHNHSSAAEGGPTLSPRAADALAVDVLSAAVDKWAGIGLGRTAVEFQFGISGGVNGWFLGSAAGDAGIRLNDVGKTLMLGVGDGTAVAQLRISNAQISTNVVFYPGKTDAATNTVTESCGLWHNTTNAPAAGFGVALNFYLQSSTTIDQLAGQITVPWTDATHLTRTADMVFYTCLNGSTQETLRLDGSSKYDLTIGGNRTLTIPATGTAALGTGAANTLAYWGGTNTLTTLANSGAVSYLRNDGAGALSWVTTVPPSAHNVLDSTYHSDVLTGAITAGDVLIGNNTPKIARLAITVPAAGVCNYFGVNNAETLPSWKSASSNPGAAAAVLATPTSGIPTLVGLITGKIYPSADSTTAVRIFQADGTTPVVTIDTTNRRLGIDCTPTQKHTIQEGHLRFNYTPSPVLTGATATAVAGAGLGIGVYHYGIAYEKDNGATTTVSISDTVLQVTTSAGNQKVTLNNIPVAPACMPAVTKRRLYRTTVGASFYNVFYLTTINDNVTTTYDDTAADGALGANGHYLENTTAGKFYQDSSLAMFLGTWQTFIGNGAGASCTSGNQNVGVGYLAGVLITTGSFNTYVGAVCGISATQGNYNTGYGNAALQNFTTGANNTAVGASALNSLAGASGNNTAVGRYAGGASATYNNSIFLGHYAGRYETIGNKLIIDSLDRATEAAQRTSAPIYGVIHATIPSQILIFNGVVNINPQFTAAGIATALTIDAQGSGANNDGGSISFLLKTSTTASQSAGLDQWLWVDATHATRKARRVWSVYDTAEREGFRIEASGAAPMIGFLGAGAVVRPTALTAQLTTVTADAAGAPDYAFGAGTNTNAWGFTSADEFLTSVAVIANLQTRLAELEDKLGHTAGLGLLTH
jgi:hypothetical protein